LFLAASFIVAQVLGNEVTAEDIMHQVAVNQDRAQAERTQYLYDQHIKVVIRRTNGKLAREETADLLVTPSVKGVQRDEKSIAGRFWKQGQYHDFQGQPVPGSGTLDGSLAEGFRNDLLNDESKDGLGKDLFPLTTDEQKGLHFELENEEIAEGRPAYRIRFRPADKSELTWSGEAVIDKEELQPVSVYTRLSRRIPFFIRTMMGTDLPGLGFSTRYKRIAKDVWFPSTFGTEFRLHAVFFINRTISVSLENRNFKHASAESTIQYQEPKAQP
jgi:hypothetical protein